MNAYLPEIPRSVAAISLIFAAAAILVVATVIPAFWDVIGEGSFVNDVMFVSLGMMMAGFPIWISVGLWRLSSDARVAALCMCWIALVFAPLGIIAGFRLNPLGALAGGIVQFMLFAWIYRILIHPDVRERFRLSNPKQQG